MQSRDDPSLHQASHSLLPLSSSLGLIPHLKSGKEEWEEKKRPGKSIMLGKVQ